MAKILYVDKVDIRTASVPAKNKVVAADMNDIKNVVNGIDDAFVLLELDVDGNTTAISGKQDALVSGVNLRTVNGNTLLGSTDLVIAPNATHSGDMVGSGALTAQSSLITGKPLVTAAGTMFALVDDGGVLKQVPVSDFLGGGGGVDTIFTGGTMTSSSVVTGGANRFKFITNSGTLGFKIERQGFPSEFVEIGGTNIKVGGSKVGGDNANVSYLNNFGTASRTAFGHAAPLYAIHCKVNNDSTQGSRIEGLSVNTFAFLKPNGLLLNDGSTNVDLRSFPGSDSYIVGNMSFGHNGASSAKVHVRGFNSSINNEALLVQNSTGSIIGMSIRNDGQIVTPDTKVFADDIAAGIGGLLPGMHYRTATGEQRVKI